METEKLSTRSTRNRKTIGKDNKGRFKGQSFVYIKTIYCKTQQFFIHLAKSTEWEKAELLKVLKIIRKVLKARLKKLHFLSIS